MSSRPGLPGHLSRKAKELAELSVKDVDVYANTELLEDRVGQLRSAFDKALSAALSARNDDRQRKGSRALPDDALLLVKLPLEDVFTASQVCRRWHSATLSRPRLWTRLEAVATIGGDKSDERGELENRVSFRNLRLLRSMLPRLQMQPLTLTVDIDGPGAIEFELVEKLDRFLELVAPRLETLYFHNSCLELFKWVFDDYHDPWNFPQLRRLVCESPEEPIFGEDYERFDLRRISCHRLAQLDLGVQLQVVNLIHQPRLTYLHTHVERLEHVLTHLRASPALTHLLFATCVSEFAHTDYSQRADIFAALNTLQELRFRPDLERDGHDVDAILDLFQQRIQCKRLVLKMAYFLTRSTFRVLLSGHWVDATGLVLRRTPDGLDIVFTDDQRRTLTIRLLDAQHVDWARVPRLHALATLRVDASVWCYVMRDFPSVPQLADTTLVVDGPEGLDAVMEAGARGLESRTPSTRRGGENGLCEAPPVPAGSRLTLSSDEPISIVKWGVADVKKRMGASVVALDGVSLG